MAATSSSHQAKPSADTTTPLSDRRNLRIMIVDDNWDTAQTLMAVLRFEGHEVWALYRANEVLGGLKHFNPDAVILDIALPDGSGFALAKDIPQHCQRYPLLIAISGIYKPDDRLASLHFDHFFTKPFDMDKLLLALEPLRKKAAS